MTEVIVALLGLAGTLAGSFLGVLASQRLTQFRLNQLENQVNKHNQIVERTFKLEGQMVECIHEIQELKSYHKP